MTEIHGVLASGQTINYRYRRELDRSVLLGIRRALRCIWLEKADKLSLTIDFGRVIGQSEFVTITPNSEVAYACLPGETKYRAFVANQPALASRRIVMVLARSTVERQSIVSVTDFLIGDWIPTEDDAYVLSDWVLDNQTITRRRPRKSNLEPIVNLDNYTPGPALYLYLDSASNSAVEGSMLTQLTAAQRQLLASCSLEGKPPPRYVYEPVDDELWQSYLFLNDRLYAWGEGARVEQAKETATLDALARLKEEREDKEKLEIRLAIERASYGGDCLSQPEEPKTSRLKRPKQRRFRKSWLRKR